MTEHGGSKVPALIQQGIDANKAAQEAAQLAARVEADRIGLEQQEQLRLGELTTALFSTVTTLLADTWIQKPVAGKATRVKEIREEIQSIREDSSGEREAKSFKTGVIFPIKTPDGVKKVTVSSKRSPNYPDDALPRISDELRVDVEGQPHTFNFQGGEITVVSRAEHTTKLGYRDSEPDYKETITLKQAEELTALLDFLQERVSEGIMPKSFGRTSFNAVAGMTEEQRKKWTLKQMLLGMELQIRKPRTLEEELYVANQYRTIRESETRLRRGLSPAVRAEVLNTRMTW